MVNGQQRVTSRKECLVDGSMAVLYTEQNEKVQNMGWNNSYHTTNLQVAPSFSSSSGGT